MGYGNRPRTNEGKLATIAYALVGIPLMLLFLSNVGKLLAKGLKLVYGYCCNCSSNDPDLDQQGLHAHHHLHDHYHVHHIALNDVNSSGHLLHCNSNNDPYQRTAKCYSACNSNSQRDQYSVGGAGLEAETKICTDMSDHHSCAGTLNRAHSHSHHSILRNANPHNTSDHMIGNSLDPVSHQTSTESETRDVTVPIILCVLLITGYVMVGASLFIVWEGFTLIDGSYIAFCLL
ncbi:unnamed protein product, partial [Medioppia subpectinata]